MVLCSSKWDRHTTKRNRRGCSHGLARQPQQPPKQATFKKNRADRLDGLRGLRVASEAGPPLRRGLQAEAGGPLGVAIAHGDDLSATRARPAGDHSTDSTAQDANKKPPNKKQDLQVRFASLCTYCSVAAAIWKTARRAKMCKARRRRKHGFWWPRQRRRSQKNCIGGRRRRGEKTKRGHKGSGDGTHRILNRTGRPFVVAIGRISGEGDG